MAFQGLGRGSTSKKLRDVLRLCPGPPQIPHQTLLLMHITLSSAYRGPNPVWREKEPREVYEMFFSSKSFWNGWRNEVFTCERNTSSDFPELNRSKSSPEVGGPRRKGLECREGRCHHKAGGMQAAPAAGVLWARLKGKDKPGLLVSRASPSSSWQVQCTCSASVPKGLVRDSMERWGLG